MGSMGCGPVKFGLEFGTFWDDSGRIRGKWEAARWQDLEWNGTFGTVSFSFARHAEIDPMCSPVWASLSSGIGGMEVLDKIVCLGSFPPFGLVGQEDVLESLYKGVSERFFFVTNKQCPSSKDGHVGKQVER
ncbi:hypothetical protein BT69DRAFT_1293605 [Atractiella rhizophila]|nr:hypothetical protein BT69DRAFT_1293605 [Atractiella rhizophila]